MRKSAKLKLARAQFHRKQSREKNASFSSMLVRDYMAVRSQSGPKIDPLRRSLLETMLSGGLRRDEMWMIGATTTPRRFPTALDGHHG